jgi:hypothetical protein
MRRVANLTKLELHAGRKLSRLQRRAELLRSGRDDATRLLDEHQIETELCGLTINLQGYWSNWCRAFYMSSTLGTVSRSGVRVVSRHPVTTEHDALTVAIKSKLISPSPSPWENHREPKWFSPSDLARVIQYSEITNHPSYVMILNSAPVGLAHLRTMRNYFAHRGESLKRKALGLGPAYLVGHARKPSEILMFVEPTRSVSVLERWILDVRRLSRALCA